MAQYLEVTVSYGDGYTPLISTKHRVPLNELTTYGVGSALVAKFQNDTKQMIEQLLSQEERFVPEAYPLLEDGGASEEGEPQD